MFPVLRSGVIPAAFVSSPMILLDSLFDRVFG